ncbi:sulfotransferase family protein [Methylotuvimicrobium buryatense]|uniref:Sulfotransferase n=1 Tax=Methylotuvimicrobium buryatense TaxID=95641 RepID=A0A4P9UNI0_METBY|nr:sulfotransferase [Methylotuvimicrobium buryatense]QCW82878.1 sulfotransferase [Methylotuvimicrobium buryatense]
MKKNVNHDFIYPVFILSCERSGSTMLRYIVDSHKEIACPGHLYIGELCASLNILLTSTLMQNQKNLCAIDKRNFVLNETRKIIDNIMTSYIIEKNKSIWCEKTPMNLEHLDLLDEHYPDAKYICLYRHCMDVVHSSLNLSKHRFLPEHVPFVHRNPGNIIAAMTENWLEKTEKLSEFEKKHQARCFRVKYESIVLEPEKTLERLFNFLGVYWDKYLIDRVFKIEHDNGEGDGRALLSSKIRQDSVGKGTEVPKSGIPDKFLSKLDALLCELGYGNLDNYYQNKGSCDRAKEIDTNILETYLENAIRANRANFPLLRGIWKIVLIGNEDGIWTIDLSGQETIFVKGDTQADFTLRLSSSLLSDMFNGIRDGIEAFSQGEIEVEGLNDKDKLISFGRLILS